MFAGTGPGKGKSSQVVEICVGSGGEGRGGKEGGISGDL